MQKVRKAVFPVAGMGTRFLPATKANPKEMLPIVDKPLIQYAAEEAVKAGIDELIFVTGRNKRSIPDHFDKAYELETELEQKGKLETLELVRDILPPEVTCVYIRQTQALGLGHAVLCAKKIVGDDPFAVILADDLIRGDGSTCLEQMVTIYNRENNSVIALQEVPREDTSKYGIVEGEVGGKYLTRMTGIVEKPQPKDARSNLAVVGRYIFNSRIFHHLEKTKPGAGGEIQLTDAIATLLQEETVYGYQFQGKRFDCGSKLGYLQASVEYGLEHAEIKAEFAEYLRNLKV
ncbi:MAG: UTP--glucose-1-phosphate uridylyltransferase GalU [Gammaproteobacteria bacterium]|nr:UTP--glucose-1-phosphate uridylyltransferase GalU [Gammaproteobacteria bacterium]